MPARGENENLLAAVGVPCLQLTSIGAKRAKFQPSLTNNLLQSARTWWWRMWNSIDPTRPLRCDALAQSLTLWRVSRVQRHAASHAKKTNNRAFMCFLVWRSKLCVLGPTEIFYFPTMEVVNIFVFKVEWWVTLRGKYRALAVVTKSISNVMKCNYIYYLSGDFFFFFFWFKKWLIEHFPIQ